MAQVPKLEDLDPLQLELLRRRLQKSKKKSRPKVEAIPRQPDAEDYPVSFAQQRLWFFDQWESESPAFNIPAAVTLRGPLDLKILGRCFDTVVERHESLRTVILRRDGDVVQKVLPPAPVDWHLVELDEADIDARRSTSDRLAREEAQRPFELTTGPLLRLTVHRLAPEEHVLVLVVHHIVSDAWSTELLVGEIVTLYGAFSQGRPSPLPELPIQYRDYAVWQRQWLGSSGAVIQRQLDYWRGQLDGAPPLVEIPTDRPRSGTQSSHGARFEIRWGAATAEGIRQLAQAHRATPYMVLLAAYAILLQRYSGQRDIVTGTLVAHRTRKEIEGLIGFFANTLVLRTDLSAAVTFDDAVECARQAALDAFAHQDIPFERLVEELNPERALGHNPLFQMMLVLLDDVREGFALDQLQIESREIEKGVANFDIYFSVMLGKREVTGWLDYNTDLYDESTVRRVFDHFRTLLDGVIAEPHARLADLPLLSAAERRQLIHTWNDTAVDYPAATTVLDLFDAQVERTPDAVAVVFEGESWSYADLQAHSNDLARRLRALGIGSETVVGVLMERSLELVAALYGILRAGGAYLPLDPGFPAERLRQVVAGAGAPVVVTQEAFRPVAEGLGSDVLVLDGSILAKDSAEPVEGGVDGPGSHDRHGLAYVIYTSGSTGRPKGVMNVHGALVNRLQWMQEAFPLDASDAVLQKTPFTFDVSVWEFFWPLMTGARLVVAKPDGHRDPEYLARLIDDQRVTTCHFVPSMLRAFLAHAESKDDFGCGTLKRLISSGEALTGDLVESTHRLLDAELHNLYGPTEAAIDVTWWPLSRDAVPAVVPLGSPIGNLRLHVLDRDFEPVPVGAHGELVIGGIGLARGYRANPALTAASFVPDPLASESEAPAGSRVYRTGDLARYRGDGTLEFLGRIDHQVKLRGLRIELGEIEAHLEAESTVQQAVVVVREDAAHDQRLVAYVVPSEERADDSVVDPDTLDLALRDQLPEYMVPSAFVVLEAFPLTPSGKVNRRALPKPDFGTAGSAYEAPRTPDEERLAETFANVLGVERVGIHDNFFHMGGHSLLATQLVSRLRDLFDLEWSLPEFFATPTVAGLAQRIHLEAVDDIDATDLEAMMSLLEGMSDEDVASALAKG